MQPLLYRVKFIKLIYFAVTRLDIHSECDQKCCGSELDWCGANSKSLY